MFSHLSEDREAASWNSRLNGNKDRLDGQCSRPDVMQLRPPVLKPEGLVRSLFAVRSHSVLTPLNASRQETCESDVALEPSGRPVLPSGQPMLILVSTCYLSSPSGRAKLLSGRPVASRFNFLCI
jgi:hypothetical protein